MAGDDLIDAEGLVQVVMAGGITTWNETGADVMRHCAELAATTPAATAS